jgi:CRISPR-associated protein Cas6
MFIDLSFTLNALDAIQVDHGYLLYSAVSRLLPAAHQADGYGIHPIRGRQLGGRTLQLTEHSRLVIRTEADEIASFLSLAGKQLCILNRPVRIGVPQVQSLVPAVAVRSRLVTIKLADAMAQSAHDAAETFRSSALRKLGELGISTAAQLSLGKRRTLRIKDKEVVGYEVLIEGLNAEESICLQEAGLGGRRHMGCGLFVPVAARGGEP